MSDRTRQYHLLRLPASTLAAARRVLEAELGAGRAAEVLREMGMESGEAFHELLRGWHAESEEDAPALEELPAEAFWERLGEFLAQLGWGRLEALWVHEGVVTLRAADWSEAGDGSDGGPGCHFTTGLLADLLRRVADADLAVLEVECRSAGDERCTFAVGAPPALEAIYEEVRRGSGFAEALSALD